MYLVLFYIVANGYHCTNRYRIVCTELQVCSHHPQYMLQLLDAEAAGTAVSLASLGDMPAKDNLSHYIGNYMEAY